MNAVPRLAALKTDPWADFWRAATPLKAGARKGKRAA
jgi:hypothetical protein